MSIAPRVRQTHIAISSLFAGDTNREAANPKFTDSQQLIVAALCGTPE